MIAVIIQSDFEAHPPPKGREVKKPPAKAGDTREVGSTPPVGKMPWRRNQQL